MKTAIKLVLIYFGIQLLGMLLAVPCAMVYCYANSLPLEDASQLALAPGMLIGFLLMAFYLYKQGYLTGDDRLYSSGEPATLGWSVLLGASAIALIDWLMSMLTFLPDLMEQTFDVLQAGWLGIVCVAVLGPVLEELLFRGAITRVLLRRYSPVQAIVISGLIFGLIHINPAQVVPACLSGVLFAWLYYRTRSLVPGILIHILNNSLSVFLNLTWPEVDTLQEVMGSAPYYGLLFVAALLFVLSLRRVAAATSIPTNTFINN